MKLYGLDIYGKNWNTRGCCPGHDLFPREKYSNRRSTKAHREATKLAHRLARRIGRYRDAQEIKNEMD